MARHRIDLDHAAALFRHDPLGSVETELGSLRFIVPGIFAASDVRHGSGKRVTTAVGEGAMAVMSVWQYRAQTGL